jgi:hypothetical protein
MSYTILTVPFEYNLKDDHINLDMLENGIKPRYSFESLPNNSSHYLLPIKCFL